MERQLGLLEGTAPEGTPGDQPRAAGRKDADWRLDALTRERGRRGVLAAREALRQAACRAGGQAA